MCYLLKGIEKSSRSSRQELGKQLSALIVTEMNLM